MVQETIKRLREIGGDVFLKNGNVRYRIPKNPEAGELLESLRKYKKMVQVALEQEGWDGLTQASRPGDRRKVETDSQ